MALAILLLLSLFLHIIMPTVFVPLFFLGILSIYILSKQYLTAFIWIIIIVLVLQMSSLTLWWQLGLYYLIWSVEVYVSSIFLDRGWTVQSIMATFFLFISNLSLNGVNIDYINIIIYTLINGIGIAIVLYTAEKFKVYEKII
ncbi:MAG: hypothetical protein RJB24_370 [Candidatus Parcubacteria bacterium]|jgi:hypothetical protein